MRKLAIILFVCCFAFASGQIRTIKTDLYEVTYSEDLEQPKIMKYKYGLVTPKFKAVISNTDVKETYGEVSFPEPLEKINYTWVRPKNIKTSDKKDYANNKYDHGHLVPKRHFVENKANRKYLFSYLNCALMHEDLNKGPWKALENKEFKMAKNNNNVHVEILVNFDQNSKTLETGATVPTSFTKTIYYNVDFMGNLSKASKITYVFPNDSSVKGKSIDDYLVE